MAPVQFDVIRRQGEAAVRNELNRAAGKARRGTSLVAQAGQLMGRAARSGEAALRQELRGGKAARRDPGAGVVATEPRPVRPAADGYVRRSPVQPVYEAADYRKKVMLKATGVVLLVGAAVAVICFLGQWGLLGR